MAQEIERKFLVKNSLWQQESIVKTTIIKQGYLCKSPTASVRIRVTNDQAFLTVKGKRINNITPEFEYEIPTTDAAEMLKLCEGPLIDKVRHNIAGVNDCVWEVDVFAGINAGLILAEVELKTPDQDIQLPPWIGTEVSSDERYVNTYLSEHKVPHH